MYKLKLLVLFFTGFLVISLGSCSLDYRVAHAWKKYSQKAPYDVIIVPGYPFRPGDTSRNSYLLNVRLHWAKELYDKGIAKNIMFSGAAVHSAYEEAKIMQVMADSLGIPPQHVFIEEKALHSTQNVAYGYRLAKKLGFKKIAFATDPYQFSYMTAFMWYSSPGAGILAFPTDSFKRYMKPLPIIDTSQFYVKDFIPLEMREGRN